MSYHDKLNAALSFGLKIENIIDDEQIHRVGTVTKPNSTNGWYVDYGSLLIMGDWQTGKSQTWKDGNCSINDHDRAKILAVINRNKEFKKRDHSRAAALAKMQYRQAAQCQRHGYLTAKGISPTPELRLANSWLLVPLFDLEAMEIKNLQRINQTGKKLFLKGGQVHGLACPIGFTKSNEAISKIYICEGYATASTVYQMTTNPCVAAMNANNLLPVTCAVRKCWPDARIIIAADDDYTTEQETGVNPGLEKAREAARIHSAEVSSPPFTPSQKATGLTDWNDFFLDKPRRRRNE